jgi:hypothetical protein
MPELNYIMETKSKSLRYFLMILIIVLLFAAAWLVARSHTGFLTDLPLTGATVTPTLTGTPAPTPAR